jgi:hypothetical protein
MVVEESRMSAPVCPYCDTPAVLRGSTEVYGPGKDFGNLWVCGNYPRCDSYVGVHRDSPIAAPLGTMANADLRKLRIKVHAAFDPLWKSGRMKRTQAYRLLSRLMGVPQAHISWFNADQCLLALHRLGRESS